MSALPFIRHPIPVFIHWGFCGIINGPAPHILLGIYDGAFTGPNFVYNSLVNRVTRRENGPCSIQDCLINLFPCFLFHWRIRKRGVSLIDFPISRADQTPVVFGSFEVVAVIVVCHMNTVQDTPHVKCDCGTAHFCRGARFIKIAHKVDADMFITIRIARRTAPVVKNVVAHIKNSTGRHFTTA